MCARLPVCIVVVAVHLFVMRSSALGQRVSFGAAAGTSLTKDFLTPTWLFGVVPDSRSFIIGPMMEAGLHESLSVEVNALHRYLHFTDNATIVPDGFVYDRRRTVGMWEFPLLLKYKLPVSKVRPFVEAGPSFRFPRTKNGSQPSRVGFKAGAGAEMRLGRVNFSPVFRYTRWAADPGFPYLPTKPDQVEFLVGVSYPSTPLTRRVFGRKLWFGVVAGAGLTGDFPSERRSNQNGVATLSKSQQSYIAGLMAELALSKRWVLEGNGLYRRLQISAGRSVVLTWEFPLLAKYRVSTSGFKPFVALGPSFRASGNRNGRTPSTYGITLGGGVEMRLGRFRVEPGVRYTRWAPDTGRNGVRRPRAESTIPNQVELLAGFSF